MITVRFVSLFGQDHVYLPDLATEFGEPSAEFPNALMEREFSDEDAAIALSNPNFVDAATGKNPNFTCADCGESHTHTVTTAAGVENSPICIACEAKKSADAAAVPATPEAAPISSASPVRTAATAPVVASTLPAPASGSAEEIN